MNARAYYNEFDPYAAQWLRNLIAAGHIARGDVDERSIVDVRADDLRGYSQCHFFAGIGGWSLALRLAGWPDDRPVWTGSCPCQPFSAAGKGKAADDERHLWPAWFSLIAECKPAIVFGEQVEAAIGWGWLDAVFADLEAEGYACGAAVLPACGVGAPHIRQRLWFVADAHGGNASPEGLQRGGQHRQQPQDGGADRELADSAACDQRCSFGSRRDPRSHALKRAGLGGDGFARGVVNAASEQVGLPGRARQSGSTDSGMGDSDLARSQGRRLSRSDPGGGNPGECIARTTSDPRNPWRDLAWIDCIDGKARPTQPGLFPLAHGVSGRVGKLRAAGNAIVPQVAAAFIEAVMI